VIHVISLGAGVQSSTMALMAAHGEITPMPECAIFADTQSEPEAVYDYLRWLEESLPFPVYHVSAGNLREDIKSGKRFASPPFFTGTVGQQGRLWRQCTSEYKVAPITRFLTKLSSSRFDQTRQVELWIGISSDEATRMKPNKQKWIRNRWPLIELGMSRQDCLMWLKGRLYPTPAKSACTFCPYHDNALWRDMKANDRRSWADAVDMDRYIRHAIPGIAEPLYLHRSMTPLEHVDFRTAEDMGQQRLFDDECEGMCGV